MSNTKLLDKKDFIEKMINTYSYRYNEGWRFTEYSKYRMALIKFLSLYSVEKRLFLQGRPTVYIIIDKCSIAHATVKTIVHYLAENYDETMHMTEDMLVIYYQNILDENTNTEQNYDLPDFD